jgi:hypothetical protein
MMGSSGHGGHTIDVVAPSAWSAATAKETSTAGANSAASVSLTAPRIRTSLSSPSCTPRRRCERAMSTMAATDGPNLPAI